MLVFKLEDHDGSVSGCIDIVSNDNLDWKVSIATAIVDGFMIFLQDRNHNMVIQYLSITDLQDLQRGIDRLLAATTGEQLCLMPIQQSTMTQD